MKHFSAMLANVATVSAIDCLCIFDVDRTLTTKQGRLSQCPDSTQVSPFVHDFSYDCLEDSDACALNWGPLLPSYSKTFCGQCYPGVVTAGTAGPETGERDLILDAFANVMSRSWADNNTESCNTRGSTAPNVAGCDTVNKSEAVRGIQAWYRSQGIDIADARVHFFDDKESNVAPFQNSSFNARQISCDSRDGSRGLCGARVDEVVDTPGVSLCSPVPVPTPAPTPAPTPSSWLPCDTGPCCNPQVEQYCPGTILCQECGGSDACQCPVAPSLIVV